MREPRATADARGLGADLEGPVASRSTAASLLLLGIAFDLSFNGQRPGASIPLFVLLVAASLRSAAPRSISADVLLGGAVFFSVFPALRASGGLIALDLLATTFLLSLAAGRDGDVFGASVAALARRFGSAWRCAAVVPGFVLAPFAGVVGRIEIERSRPALRAVGIGLPAVAVFAALLAAADRVFAQIITPDLPRWNFGRALAHVTLTLFGTWLIATLWRSAIEEREPAAKEAGEPGAAGGGKRPGAEPRGPRFAFVEWATVLAGIDLLFGLFVAVQFAFLFGGRERVLVTPGLTYAEYARSGFFQLIVVAILTLLVILGAWDLGRRADPSQERWFRRLVTAMVGLSFVILASALMRLALYEATFGFTANRLVGYVAIAWIGFVLAATLLAIRTGRRDRVVSTVLAGALAALLVVNVMNPERFVAARNVARFSARGEVDVAYLGRGLGADAIPLTAPLLGRLTGEDARLLREALCVHAAGLGPEPSWRSWNLGRSSARMALEEAGVDARTCALQPPLPAPID